MICFLVKEKKSEVPTVIRNIKDCRHVYLWRSSLDRIISIPVDTNFTKQTNSSLDRLKWCSCVNLPLSHWRICLLWRTISVSETHYIYIFWVAKCICKINCNKHYQDKLCYIIFYNCITCYIWCNRNTKPVT